MTDEFFSERENLFMANSFEVNIDDLDEDTTWDMLENFASDDLEAVRKPYKSIAYCSSREFNSLI